MTLPYERFIVQNFEVMSTSGDEFVCKCPWHDDKRKPNLYINGRRGLYICHACLAKGHLSRLGSDILVPEVSLADLQQQVGELKKQIHEHSDRKRRKLDLSELDKFDFDCDYWSKGRLFGEDTIKEFKLGYDPVEDVATIPLFHVNGELVAVLTRRLDDRQPKYRHPSGLKKSRYLYAADKVFKPSSLEQFAVVEGPLDAIACWEGGVPAVAMMGSSLSKEQADLILASGAWRVVAMTDNDAAGRRAVCSLVENLPGIHVAVGVYGESIAHIKDPGDMMPSAIKRMYEWAVPWYTAPYEELAELRYGLAL